MTRREYGSGSVYQRADGRWMGTLDVGWSAKGTRRRITVSGKTQAEAKRKLRDKRLAIEREGLAPTSSRATVKTWADQWLPMQERHLSPNAYAATRSAVTRWIVPTIGHKRLDLLTPGDIRAVSQAQRKADRSTSTAVRTHSVLTGLLKAAMAEGFTVPPRVLLTKKPTLAVNDRADIGVDNARAILEHAADLPHGSRWVAAFLQGIRQGEALGLTWPQVDLDAQTITISWQQQALPYRISRDRSSGFRVPDGYEARQLKGALHLVRPKSKAGWRVIPLIDAMAAVLTAWREVCPPSSDELVWPNDDGTPRYYKADDREWYALQDAAGVRHPTGRYFTVHEARHTTATLLLEAHVDHAVVIAILGHSSILTSRGYQHASQSVARAALDDIAARLQLG